MTDSQQRRSLAGWATAALISAAVAGGFVLSGGLGNAPQGHASAPPQQAGVGVLTCVPSQQVHGTVVVDTNYTGKMYVGLFYETFPKKLGPARWVDTGTRAVAYFHDKQSDAFRKMGAYWFGFIPQPWHTLYRVQVVRPGPALVLGAASPSFRLCDPGAASQGAGAAQVTTVTADANTVTAPSPADPPSTQTVTQTISVNHPTTQTITSFVPTTLTSTSISVMLLPAFETITTFMPTTETTTAIQTTTSVVTQDLYVTVTVVNTSVSTDTSTVTSSTTNTSTVTSSTTDTSTVTSSTTDTSTNTTTSTSTTTSTKTSGTCAGNSQAGNGNNCNK